MFLNSKLKVQFHKELLVLLLETNSQHGISKKLRLQLLILPIFINLKKVPQLLKKLELKQLKLNQKLLEPKEVKLKQKPQPKENLKLKKLLKNQKNLTPKLKQLQTKKFQLKELRLEKHQDNLLQVTNQDPLLQLELNQRTISKSSLTGIKKKENHHQL